MKVTTKELSEYMEKDVLRGFLIETFLDPDKEHEIDLAEFLYKDIKSGKQPGDIGSMMYKHRAHRYDRKKCSCFDLLSFEPDEREWDGHPNDWSGLCYTCYIKEKKSIYHYFKGASVIKYEKEQEEKKRKERIDNIITETEELLKSMKND